MIEAAVAFLVVFLGLAGLIEGALRLVSRFVMARVVEELFFILSFYRMSRKNVVRLFPTMTQETALSILKTGANVFLTGEPGSGKTYVINQYIAWLEAA